MTYNPLSLAQQCIQMLGDNAVVLSKKETEAQWNLLKRMVPFTKNGKVAWEKVTKKQLVSNDVKEILGALQDLLERPIDKTIFIQWSDSTLPIIQTDLDAALSLLEPIRKVTFELFLFNPHQGYLIEVISRGQITVGLVKSDVRGN
jgi:hypothetical protein